MAQTRKTSVEECSAAFEAVRKNKDKVKPRDEDDYQITSLDQNLSLYAAGCFSRAGDCKKAREAFDATFPPDRLKDVKEQYKAEAQTGVFESSAPKCKAKPVAAAK